MRIPYVPNPPEPASDEEAAIVERIQARRAPRPLQPLDLALLHSPPVADGWNSFLGAVRTRTSLAADLREIAVSRVAVVNRAWYEWMHHTPLAEQAGVSKTGMNDVVRRETPLELLSSSGSGAPVPVPVPEDLTEKQWLVACYTDEMTRNVQVKDETFARLKEVFTDREIVEITATIACYNCVSRFLVALDVGEKNGVGPDAAH
ncbi:AhpD-like protein [Corynascus novoguineensis]|uniref:AhpD-like protein n=1 Tax=Corynascus novoguineensis TaxID=1126955 RepID=A0AAN7CVU7_9PEZI|nr:AhpD-like protein [Corynascus novoguineensis]